MAEPQGHLSNVAGGLEHHHGTAVPELMGRDGAPNQSGMPGRRVTRVFVEDVFKPSPRHRRALQFVYFSTRAKEDVKRKAEYQARLKRELAEAGKI